MGATFDVILADPPWKDLPFGDLERVAVPTVANTGTVLFLWVPTALKYRGFLLAGSWGFQYKTTIYWDTMEDQVDELLVFARDRRGVLWASLPAIIRAPAPDGGGRPAEFRRLIEQITGKFSRRDCLELFARKPVPGWTAVGLPGGDGVRLDLRRIYEGRP